MGGEFSTSRYRVQLYENGFSSPLRSPATSRSGDRQDRRAGGASSQSYFAVSLQFAQLLSLQRRLGKANFPLMEQTFFPNHLDMVSSRSIYLLYTCFQCYSPDRQSDGVGQLYGEQWSRACGPVLREVGLPLTENQKVKTEIRNHPSHVWRHYRRSDGPGCQHLKITDSSEWVASTGRGSQGRPAVYQAPNRSRRDLTMRRLRGY